MCMGLGDLRRKDAHHSFAFRKSWAYSRSMGPAWVQLKLLACGCLGGVTLQSQTSQRLCNLIYVGVWCPEPSGRRTRGVALVLGIQW